MMNGCHDKENMIPTEAAFDFPPTLFSKRKIQQERSYVQLLLLFILFFRVGFSSPL